MKKIAVYLSVLMLTVALSAYAATKIRNAAITNSTIDTSAISSSTATLTTLAVGSGTTINQIYFGTLTLTYPAINVGACMNQTGTFTGVLASAYVGVNRTAGTAAGIGAVNLNEKAWSATDGNVTVEVCNTTTNAVLNWTGGSVTYNVLVVE